MVEATVLTTAGFAVAGGDVICCPATVVAGLFKGCFGCARLVVVTPGCCSATSCI